MAVKVVVYASTGDIAYVRPDVEPGGFEDFPQHAHRPAYQREMLVAFRLGHLLNSRHAGKGTLADAPDCRDSYLT